MKILEYYKLSPSKRGFSNAKLFAATAPVILGPIALAGLTQGRDSNLFKLPFIGLLLNNVFTALLIPSPAQLASYLPATTYSILHPDKIATKEFREFWYTLFLIPSYLASLPLLTGRREFRVKTTEGYSLKDHIFGFKDRPRYDKLFQENIIRTGSCLGESISNIFEPKSAAGTLVIGNIFARIMACLNYGLEKKQTANNWLEGAFLLSAISGLLTAGSKPYRQWGGKWATVAQAAGSLGYLLCAIGKRLNLPKSIIDSAVFLSSIFLWMSSSLGSISGSLAATRRTNKLK